MNKLKTWWKKRSYWQKGAWIGFVIVILFFVISNIIGEIQRFYNYEVDLNIAKYIVALTVGLPALFSDWVFRLFVKYPEDYLLIMFVAPLFLYVGLGALIGFIIGKVKGK